MARTKPSPLYAKHVPQYHQNDVDTQLKLLGEAHTRDIQRQRFLHVASGGMWTDHLPDPWDVKLVASRLVNRIKRRLFGVSKYQPHQGAKECARRVQQGVK
jgi:hypothetical protein